MEPNMDMKKAKRKSFMVGLVTGVCLVLVAVCGVYAGASVQRLIAAKNNAVSINCIINFN